MARLFLIAGLLIGCTCGAEEPPLEAPRVGSPRARSDVATRREPAANPEPRRESWSAAVIELTPRPAATRVTVRPSRVDIDNDALVRTWPAAAVERAREVAEPAHPAWPRLAFHLEAPEPDRLLEALATARRAERASTGAGSGAGVVDLRVAADVPWGELSETLLAAGRAGYARTRLLLEGPESELVAFEWRHAASSSSAPTLDEIRAAMGAIARGEEPRLEGAASGRRARFRCSLGHAGLTVRVFVGGERQRGVCDVATPARVQPCVRSLGVVGVNLEVDPRVPFGELSPYWQHLSLATDALALRSLTPRPATAE